MVETLETSHTWSRLHELHAAVGGGDPRRARRPGHARARLLPPLARLRRRRLALLHLHLPRRAAARRSSSGGRSSAPPRRRSSPRGGTITHHHAVGRDHAPYMEAEVGETGIDVLRAVKERLDPAGIMNPGKLLPRGLAAFACAFAFGDRAGDFARQHRFAGVAGEALVLLRPRDLGLVGGVVGARDVDLVEGAAGDVGEQFGRDREAGAEAARFADGDAADPQRAASASGRARRCRTGPCRSAARFSPVTCRTISFLPPGRRSRGRWRRCRRPVRARPG